jgi:hypothetical protein
MRSRLRLCLSTILLACICGSAAKAQGTKLYLNPELFLGITVGHDYDKGLKLDFGNLNRSIGLALKGGYKINQRLSVFTGVGYQSYKYRMIGRAAVTGPDTVRQQSQEFWEIPLGVRVATFYGYRSFKTRFYGAAGLKGCLQSDARHDYVTSDKAHGDINIVRPEDYNKFWVRWFLEGGLDIPMDFDSAILLGLSVSSGLTRNMNTDGALTKDNYGVLVIGATAGVRFGF